MFSLQEEQFRLPLTVCSIEVMLYLFTTPQYGQCPSTAVITAAPVATPIIIAIMPKIIKIPPQKRPKKGTIKTSIKPIIVKPPPRINPPAPASAIFPALAPADGEARRVFVNLALLIGSIKTSLFRGFCLRETGFGAGLGRKSNWQFEHTSELAEDLVPQLGQVTNIVSIVV